MESNKDVVRRFVARYNEGAWDALDGLVTEDYVHHSNDQELSLAQFKQGAAWFRAGIPDFTVGMEALVTEDDFVVGRWVSRGTHAHSMLGEAPTSGEVVLYGITMFRLRDGRIAEDWEAMDERDLLRQIGATPAGG